MIVKLASHYHRPDFGPEQAKHMALDFIEDLGQFAIHEIDQAVREYRCNSKNKFFPTPGNLIDIIGANRKHKADVEKIGPAIRNFDSRPHFWWMQPRQFWKEHWRESDIPAGHFVRDEHTGEMREPVGA